MQIAPGATLIAVLCGGNSRRMGGRPKATLPLGGTTVLQKILATTAELQLPTVLVAAHESQPQDPDLVHLMAAVGLPLVRDLVPAAGPLAGLHAAFEQTAAGRVLLLACDLPFVTVPFLDQLLVEAETHGSVAPTDATSRRHPLCAVYDADCRSHLAASLEQRQLRMQTFCEAIGMVSLPATAWSAHDPEGRLLMNLNDPEQYEMAQNLIDRT